MSAYLDHAFLAAVLAPILVLAVAWGVACVHARQSSKTRARIELATDIAGPEDNSFSLSSITPARIPWQLSGGVGLLVVVIIIGLTLKQINQIF